MTKARRPPKTAPKPAIEDADTETRAPLDFDDTVALSGGGPHNDGPQNGVADGPPEAPPAPESGAPEEAASAAGEVEEQAPTEAEDDLGEVGEPEDPAPEDPAPEALLSRTTEDAAPEGGVSRAHLKGLLEALVFVSDHPVKTGDLARAASAPVKLVRELLAELRGEYQQRGIQLDEVAGGWIYRSSALYAPFVRDKAMQKPVRLTRAQTETLAILAYRQPITRPEVDDIRGVDSGPILKLLLERDLVRILGRKDEPGRPVLYGTTTVFLEFFGLKSLKDLPTLREFTDLNEDSRRVVERELGEVLDGSQPSASVAGPEVTEAPGEPVEAVGEGSLPPEEGATEADAGEIAGSE